MSAKAFAKSHQPAGRASGPCRNFRPHSAPEISPTSAASGKPLALRLPASHQATARVSPGRQKSEHRGPAPGEPLHRPALPFRSATPPQIVEDRLPRRHEHGSFAKSPQPASRASGPCQNFRPHDAPNISPTSAAPGKPLALRLPAARQATAHVSPGPAQVGTTRPRAPLMATTLTSSASGVAQGVRYRNLRTTPVCCHSPPR